MDKKAWEKELEEYDRIVAMQTEFKRKGKTVPYTSANGYMFSLLNKEGKIGFRLSPASGKKFMEDHNTTIFKSHGAVMRDYVLIPKRLYTNDQLMKDTLYEGYQYVMSLPPK